MLEEINAEGFTPKQFTSSAVKENKFKNIVIDISSDTIQIPSVPNIPSGLESIFHTSVSSFEFPNLNFLFYKYIGNVHFLS